MAETITPKRPTPTPTATGRRPPCWRRGGSSWPPRIPGRCDWPLERPRGRTATSGRSRSTLESVRSTWRPRISSSSARPWVGRARRTGNQGPGVGPSGGPVSRGNPRPPLSSALPGQPVFRGRGGRGEAIAPAGPGSPGSAPDGDRPRELDDPAGVAEALQRWLQLDPTGREGLPDPLRSYQIQLARALLRSQQPAKARGLLQKVLESGPDEEATWLLSRTYVQEQDWKRAEALANEVPSYRKEHPLEWEPAPFVGEARCTPCHRPESESVLASRTRHHLRPGSRPGCPDHSQDSPTRPAST